MPSLSLLVNTMSLNQSTYNTNRHCRVRFYAFVGQPLSQQLYLQFLLATYIVYSFSFGLALYI